MRLGDLDALKEHAKNLLVGESINTVLGINLYKIFEEIIDNALTVDTDEIYKQGYHAGFCATHGEPERLRGKWIEDNDIGKWLTIDDTGIKMKNKCNRCGRYVLNKENFCPDCGAYMEDDQK